MLKQNLSVMALLAVGALAITSCGRDRRDDDVNRPKDSGTNPPDSDDAGGIIDSGGNNDTGAQDTGVQTAECAANTDCVAPDTHCLNIDATNGLVQCTGQDTCQCWQGCDPFVSVEQSGCARPAEACGIAGAMSPTAGVCTPDMGGGTQGQECTSMWTGNDAFRDFNGDSCNGAQNFICYGSDPLDVTGTCARLCDTANGALCTLLGPGTECIPFAPGQTQGVCITPTTDLGTDCTSNTGCQGGYCALELGGLCSQQCGLAFTCGQPEGLCLFAPDLISPLCARSCSAAGTGDPECAAIPNPDTICENVSPDPANPVNICVPRCTMNTDCGAAPATCNVATGHCM